jgi:N-acetylglucosamine-6-phosphate deacetylase
VEVNEPILIRGLTGQPSSVLVSDGRIAALDGEADAVAARVIVGEGLRAVPGFIDLQVNAVDERDFTTDPGAMWQVGETLARHGVTAFLPTVVTSPRGAVEAALHALAARPPDPCGAFPLGLHVEGPFISPARRGAHEERHLRTPDLDEIASWVAAGARIVTIAPELPGAVAAIERIVAAGAVASIGHTDADDRTAIGAVEAGARYATHLFNAMPPLHHRAPGAVGALLDDDRVTIGLIADGVHVDPLIMRLVARLAPSRVSLVSDAVCRRLTDAPLAADGDAARLADGTLAGGVHSLDHGVRTFAAATGSLAAAIDAVTAVPARLLGLEDGRGALRVGGRADLVLLDEALEVAGTIVAGRPAHLTDRVRWP